MRAVLHTKRMSSRVRVFAAASSRSGLVLTLVWAAGAFARADEPTAAESVERTEAAAPAAVDDQDATMTVNVADMGPNVMGELVPIRRQEVSVPSAPRAETRSDGLRANDCCEVGAFQDVFEDDVFFLGDAITIDEEVILTEFSMELDFVSSVPETLTFGVFRFDTATTNYEPVSIFTRNRLGIGQAFYTSGAVTIPLTLNSNGFGLYAIGVGWNGPDVQFGRDSDTYPQFGCAGTVQGSWGFASAPPPTGSMDLLPIGELFRNGVLSMELCFLAAPGACCLTATAECVVVAGEAECLNQNGVFTAAGVQCNIVSCPLPRGACCIEPDSCAFVNEFTCTTGLEGISWDPDDNCAAPHPCAPPTGSCCIYDGTCQDDLTEAECVSLPGGDYNGDFSFCSQPGIQCIATGACCLADASCIEAISSTDCADNGGVNFHGLGSHCQEFPDFPLDPCDNQLGACCFYDGMCTALMTRYDCETNLEGGTPGVWAGPGVSCSAAECEVQGACCDGFFSCTDTALEDCNTNLFTWTQGEPCRYSPCAGEVGACCVLGECEITNEFDCLVEDGMFTPAGTAGFNACVVALAGDNCLNGDEGACCLLSGGEPYCEEMRPSDCASMGGLFQGQQVSCSEYTCVESACCGAGGPQQCSTLYPLECLGSNGLPALGDECHGGQPCLEGACCVDEQCSVISELECDLADGDFKGAGTSCQAGTCAPIGACCLGTACAEGTESFCDGVSGAMYQGDFTTCSGGNACRMGACCEPDGECTQLTKAQCELDKLHGGPDGTYEGANLDCMDVECSVYGACCIGGMCEQMTEANCLSSFGTYFGDLTGCQAGICDEGVCCPGFGDSGEACVDTMFRGFCNGLFLPGTDCNTSGSACTAPCCMSGSNGCVDMAPADCVNTGGFPGLRSEGCSEDPDYCKLGACCIGGFFCAEMSSQECAEQDPPTGGAFAGRGSECFDGTACNRGACCELDGDCLGGSPGLIKAECELIGTATFYQGGNCSMSPCSDSCVGLSDEPFDVNADGKVDLGDFSEFQLCFGDAPSTACICVFDSNQDGAVNLQDYADMETVLEGP